MAVIGQIRQRAGLLIGIVGFSLIAFILGDLLTSNRSFLSGNETDVAIIGGNKIGVLEFEAMVQQMEQNYRLNTGTETIDQTTLESLREQAWTQLLNEQIMNPQYRKAGIKVSPEEIFDMIQGKNPHPQIKDAFKDPNTGEFSPASVLQFLKNMDNDQTGKTRAQWVAFEKFLIEERIKEKYNELVKKGMFATTHEAKRQYENQQRMAKVRFIDILYTSVEDSLIKVDDKEMRAYYNANKNDFKQEASRNIEYVTFEVTPSQEDRDNALSSIQKLVESFRESTDDSLFVAVNSDTRSEIDYFKSGMLSPSIDQTFFEATEAGIVAGPYEENSAFKLSKLIEIKTMPDSLKVSHVLVAYAGAERAPAELTRTREEAETRADSLLAVIKKDPKRYNEIARTLSDDVVAAEKDGDLEWITRQSPMDPKFKDGAFNTAKDEVSLVESNFGIHLIKVTDQTTPIKQVKVATIDRKINPGSKTFQAAFAKANEFASQNTTNELFNSAVVNQGLNKRVAENIKESDKIIPGLENPRILVQWAYNSQEGDVSKPYDFGNRFVVATLTQVKEKGIPPMNQVADLVRGKVITEKKAQQFAERFNSARAKAKSIDEIAAALNLQVKSADNVSFSSGYVQNLGSEPEFVGTVFSSKAGELSNPVEGVTGVFMLVVDSFTEPAATTDFANNKTQLEQQLQQRTSYEVFNALKEKANITDNRGRFY